jgi:DNA-binding transcriptional MerR regulator
MPFTAKKLYYKIGEVCEILAVEPHVLRYWESEFPNLAPPKNKAGQRTYRPKDIELLMEIRRLLYEEGYTIAGAKRRLGVKGPAEKGPAAEGGAPPRRAKSRKLQEVRQELENILTLLRRE